MWDEKQLKHRRTDGQEKRVHLNPEERRWRAQRFKVSGTGRPSQRWTTHIQTRRCDIVNFDPPPPVRWLSDPVQCMV